MKMGKDCIKTERLWLALVPAGSTSFLVQWEKPGSPERGATIIIVGPVWDQIGCCLLLLLLKEELKHKFWAIRIAFFLCGLVGLVTR